MALAFREVMKSGRYGAPITSDYVLDETTTLLRMRKGIAPALSFLDQAFQSRNLNLVWMDPSLFKAATGVLRESHEARWSFTDCASFAIMRQLGIKEAFTFDGNFEEAGFTKLP